MTDDTFATQDIPTRMRAMDTDATYERARRKAAEELTYLADDAVFQARTDKNLTQRTEATRYQALRAVDTIAYMVAKLYDLELPERFTSPTTMGEAIEVLKEKVASPCPSIMVGGLHYRCERPHPHPGYQHFNRRACLFWGELTDPENPVWEEIATGRAT